MPKSGKAKHSALAVAGGGIEKCSSKAPKAGTQVELGKQKGQHLLKNPGLAETIASKADVRSGDTVLEIGPGTGNLTLRLLERARSVVAVELDSRLASELCRRFRGSEHEHKLRIFQADVMHSDLPHFDLCVANIPYQISSPLIFKLLSCNIRYRAAVIMFQREFAQRLLAQPGSSQYCRLSANVQLLARVEHLTKVSRNSFKPPPKVDSSVVRIEPKIPSPPVDFTEWDGLARLLFNRKNKTVSSIFRQKATLELMQRNFNTLAALSDRGGVGVVSTSSGMDVDHEPKTNTADVDGLTLDALKDRIVHVLQSEGFENMRSAKMTQEDILRLLAAMNKHGFHFS